MPPRSEAIADVVGASLATDRPLRIAFAYDALVPYQRGGAEQRYFELARRLQARHEVHYFSWKYWDGPAVVVRDGVTYHGVGTPRPLYGADGKRTIKEAAEFAVALGKALAGKAFDVVDCSATPYVPLYACWAATRTSGTPLIATWHEYWGPHWMDYLPQRPNVARTARALERGSIRFADRLIAVSDFTAAQMPVRIMPTVVENGMGLRPASRPNQADRGLKVLFVGRLIDDKHVDILLRAMSLVIESVPEATCTIIGDGPERPALESLCDALALTGSVRFLGHVDEDVLTHHLASAAVFAFPSVREGFGICVAEAQAFGAVPIVARAPHSAAPTLVVDSVTGIVCEPEAPAFAEAIAGLLLDPVRRQGMAAAGVEHARRWDWDDITARMEDLYADVAARKHRRWTPPWGKPRINSPLVAAEVDAL